LPSKSGSNGSPRCPADSRPMRAAHVPSIWATQVLETLAKTGSLPRRSHRRRRRQRAECVMLNKGPTYSTPSKPWTTSSPDGRSKRKSRTLMRRIHSGTAVTQQASSSVPVAVDGSASMSSHGVGARSKVFWAALESRMNGSVTLRWWRTTARLGSSRRSSRTPRRARAGRWGRADGFPAPARLPPDHGRPLPTGIDEPDRTSPTSPQGSATPRRERPGPSCTHRASRRDTTCPRRHAQGETSAIVLSPRLGHCIRLQGATLPI